MMITFVSVNWLAILAGGVISMITGMLWYGPKTMGPMWMKFNNLDQSQMDPSGVGKLYFLQFVSALLFTYVLAIVLHFLGALTVKDGLMDALWLWAGFLVFGGVGMYLFPPKSLNLFLFDNAYKLINILIIAAVLVKWH